MRDLVLVGAGSWSKSIVPLFKLEPRLLQFYDETVGKYENHFGRPVTKVLLSCYDFRKYNAPIGDPRNKRKLILEIMEKEKDSVFINLLWKDNIIVKTARLGKGLMVQPTAKIYHNARIGDHVSICGDGNIGHDSRIGDYCTLGPYVLLCGGVQVEEGVFLGAGCKLLPDVHVGKGSIIGAGAVVTKDIPPNSMWAGLPAKHLKKIGENW